MEINDLTIKFGISICLLYLCNRFKHQNHYINTQYMQVLSKWLARQTVNLFPSGRGGSSPPTCTNHIIYTHDLRQ